MRIWLAALLALVSSTTLAQTPQAAPSSATAARDEAVTLLRDLIRIDTSNPPGNETKATEHLKAIFDREGIPAALGC